MEHVTPSESWSSAAFGFDSVAFKGGWGPEPDGYLVRQSGIVDPGTSSAVAVAIVTHPGEFDTQTITDAADWLKHELVVSPRQGSACG